MKSCNYNRQVMKLFLAFSYLCLSTNAFQSPLIAQRLSSTSQTSSTSLQVSFMETPAPLHESPTVERTTTSTHHEGASIPNLTVSLVKSIVGGGVLALPAGVAALGDNESVLPLACAIILATGGLNAFFFSLLGRVCGLTGATSYKEAWEKSVGPESSHWVAGAVTLKTALSCLAYTMILGDSVQSLLHSLVGVDISRADTLWAITLTVLLPLSLQKDLSSLAPFSLAGLLGMFVAGGSIITRCLDGSYTETGKYLAEVPLELQPAFGMESHPSLHGVVLVCTLATAFVAHYNGPRFHAELRDNTDDRFNMVTGISFTLSAVFFALVAAAGYLTFGEHSQGFILNNYAGSDPLVVLTKMALAASVALTYPLPFFGLRDGCLDLIQVEERDADTVTIATLVLLPLITFAATNVDDLALLLSVGGGTFSTAVSSVFPTLMFRASHGDNVDTQLAMAGMVTSVAIGLTGVGMALSSVF